MVRQILLRSHPITTRFRLPMTKEQAADALRGAIMAEVARRHRSYVESAELMSQIEQMAQWLTSPQGKFCMLLCGTCGNGKTTFVKALQALLCMLELTDADNERCGFQIMDAKDIAWMCRDERPAWQKLCRRKMLAIDDLGTEPTEVQEYGNRMNPVIDLFYKRYDMQLFTIITTNLLPDEIRKKYGDRVADRLNEMACRIVFENDSYRSVSQINNI